MDHRPPYSLRPFFAVLIGFGLAMLALWWLAQYAKAEAHDSWISRGGLKNGAGEWCCGEGDCFRHTIQADRPTAPIGAASGRMGVKTMFLCATAEHVRFR